MGKLGGDLKMSIMPCISGQSDFPGRAGRYLPAPTQTGTSGFPASRLMSLGFQIFVNLIFHY